jgi:hypothetical protein
MAAGRERAIALANQGQEVVSQQTPAKHHQHTDECWKKPRPQNNEVTD